MARLVWSSAARDDLKALVSFIKADSPGHAKTFGLHIQQRVDQLQHFPESGRQVPEDETGAYRELIVGHYRVVYRVDRDTVTIVTLIHGAASSAYEETVGIGRDSWRGTDPLLSQRRREHLLRNLRQRGVVCAWWHECGSVVRLDWTIAHGE